MVIRNPAVSQIKFFGQLDKPDIRTYLNLRKGEKGGLRTTFSPFLIVGLNWISIPIIARSFGQIYTAGKEAYDRIINF